ncbi:MAG: MerR family transcriptional regulator [Desulfosarcinaceae bacterium]|nr:MerR family transcriptional regulator [Desulfosarcinaceae bacterium]
MSDPSVLDSKIPDKLYFRIGEVAELAGVPSYVLRFWETEFPRIKPKRTRSGQRLYRRSDVSLVLTIKHLLHERRFTIQGAKKHLRARSVAKSSPPAPDAQLIQVLRTELEQIRDLLK